MRNETLIVEDLLLLMFDDKSGTIAGRARCTTRWAAPFS